MYKLKVSFMSFTFKESEMDTYNLCACLYVRELYEWLPDPHDHVNVDSWVVACIPSLCAIGPIQGESTDWSLLLCMSYNDGDGSSCMIRSAITQLKSHQKVSDIINYLPFHTTFIICGQRRGVESSRYIQWLPGHSYTYIENATFCCTQEASTHACTPADVQFTILKKFRHTMYSKWARL